jgi:hypothetical protein
MIIASCGHQVNTVTTLTTKYVTREGHHALRYGSYCPKCATMLVEADEVLYNEEQESEWLNINSYEYHEDYL